MLLIAALLRATALVIAGYFVWFAASKADDRLKAVGKLIALWCAAFAVVLVIAGITSAFMRPMGMRFHGPGPGMMHGGMMSGMMWRGGHREGGPRFLFRERGTPPEGVPEPKSETPPPTPKS